LIPKLKHIIYLNILKLENVSKKSILVLGSGRSGTSLASGILSKAGYYMGENLMPATHTNPKGFFESFDI
jgi:hypothetical protein